MYLIGFIKTDRPRVLINPQKFSNIDDLYVCLKRFYNDQDYSLDKPIIKEVLIDAFKSPVPLQVNMAGYNVALLMADEKIMAEAIDRHFITDTFKFPNY
jgi:hypothetical protein